MTTARTPVFSPVITVPIVCAVILDFLVFTVLLYILGPIEFLHTFDSAMFIPGTYSTLYQEQQTNNLGLKRQFRKNVIGMLLHVICFERV